MLRSINVVLKLFTVALNINHYVLDQILICICHNLILQIMFDSLQFIIYLIGFVSLVIMLLFIEVPYHHIIRTLILKVIIYYILCFKSYLQCPRLVFNLVRLVNIFHSTLFIVHLLVCMYF